MFVVGGWALIWLLESFSLDLGQWPWLLAIMGGMIGLILAISLFDVALIVLSVLDGAVLIVQVTSFNALVVALIFLVLIVLDIVIQVKTSLALHILTASWYNARQERLFPHMRELLKSSR